MHGQQLCSHNGSLLQENGRKEIGRCNLHDLVTGALCLLQNKPRQTKEQKPAAFVPVCSACVYIVVVTAAAAVLLALWLCSMVILVLMLF